MGCYVKTLMAQKRHEFMQNYFVFTPKKKKDDGKGKKPFKRKK